MNYREGEVLLFDKPYRWTSFDLVNKVRKLLEKQDGEKKRLKVGHAGTLDPLATGLMIICTGKETKNIEKYQAVDKEYIATIELGKTTPSFDLETEVDQEYGTSHITPELLQSVLTGFLGEGEQVPPLHSAKSINGKRAYELARKGVKMELKPSRVAIHLIELLEFELPLVKFLVKCSKGTYIRAMARDIGARLGSGAHLVALQRTAIGEWKLDQAISLEEFEKGLHPCN